MDYKLEKGTRKDRRNLFARTFAGWILIERNKTYRSLVKKYGGLLPTFYGEENQ
jgi:hypothetical protein